MRERERERERERGTERERGRDRQTAKERETESDRERAPSCWGLMNEQTPALFFVSVCTRHFHNDVNLSYSIVNCRLTWLTS